MFFTEFFTSETRMRFDALLKVIARDCINNKCKRSDNPLEFTKEQEQKYKTLDPQNRFWGGYAYLDDTDDGVVSGFIRLYNPYGSTKWSFLSKGGDIEVDPA